MDRGAALERLGAGETFDLLIIGGGAVGLGTAVEAAARGLRVALVERGDFAGGTSSRSTKLVHGGVRYLRQGNLSLVREGLRERARLLRNAPHLVTPLEFAVPCFGPIDTLFYGAGLKFYDALAAGHRLSPSRIVSAAALRREVAIKEDGLFAGVVYRDAQFDDARLAVTLARTAEGLGAVLANYCAATGLTRKGDRLSGAEVQDEETGKAFAISARCVVNATGVFVDDLRRQDDAAVAPLVTVSQGIHLVLPRRFLPGAAALMVPKTSDGRVLFAIPWNDRVVLGTTDTPMPEAVREPRALVREREFLLEHARRYLAEAPQPGDVLSIFAGLRPLVRKQGRVATAALSREHAIVISPSGLVTVTGGKWTTYRQMGEDVVDHARAVGQWAERPSPTANLRLHGALGAEAAGAAGPYRRYGSDAAHLAQLEAADPSLAGPIHPRLPYRRAEVVWQARNEMARSVEDVLARRTRSLLLDAQASIEAAPAVAALLAEALGRSPAWQAEQISRYAALASGYVFSNPASTPSPLT